MANERSPFNPQMHGIKLDPKKDYRWVKENRIGERKEMDGFSFVKPSDGKNTSDTRVKSRGMTFMERPKILADESARRKELKTRQMTESYKGKLKEDVERLSGKHNKNLHEAYDDLEE